MPLARKLARRYVGANEPYEDLLQVASFGLVKAIDRFDPERGLAFSSFAVPTIVGELKRYFRDFGWAVHVPRGAQERALKISGIQRTLTERLGRSPTVSEIGQYMELGVEEVVEALEASAAHHAISLDTPREDGEDGSGVLSDSFGADDAGYEQIETSVILSDAARHLTDDERRVLRLRYAEDLTQTEIAAIIGVSQMQVSRILARSIARLATLMQPAT